jgi:hypothetical protein
MGRLLFFLRTGSQRGPVLFLFLALGCSTSANRFAVRDSILGVRIGSDLEEAREKLSPLAQSPSAEPADEEREAGKKEAWVLRNTEFKSVAVQADRSGKIVWVTGFLRAGREIAFAQIGDLRAAIRATENEAIWNVPTSRGGYRLVAKGQKGKARIIYLLAPERVPE